MANICNSLLKDFSHHINIFSPHRETISAVCLISLEKAFNEWQQDWVETNSILSDLGGGQLWKILSNITQSSLVRLIPGLTAVIIWLTHPIISPFSSMSHFSTSLLVPPEITFQVLHLVRGHRSASKVTQIKTRGLATFFRMLKKKKKKDGTWHSMPHHARKFRCDTAG